jgi:hypothetical protein
MPLEDKNIYKSAEERREKIEDKLNEIDLLTNKTGNLSKQEKEKLYNEALDILKPQIISMLVQNYNSSGVKTRTGTLLSNIKKANISIKIKGAAPELQIKMPQEGSLKKYKGKNADETYKAINAVDAGSVRTGMHMGQKANKKIKKKYQKGKAGVDVIAGMIVDMGDDGSITSTDTKQNKSKISVTKAYDFFKLTKSQIQRVETDLREIIDSMLFN